MMRWLLVFLAIRGFAAFNLTWGVPAANLDTNPPIGDTDSNAAIVMDREGNAVATWSRSTGKGAAEDIWTSFFHHASRVWTGAVKISGGGNASNCRVSLGNGGNAVFVWEEGFPTQIMTRSLTAEGIWTPCLSDVPPEFACESLNAQTMPQICTDSEGNCLIIWMEYYKGMYHIHSAKMIQGQEWVNLGRISSGNNAVLIPNKALSMNSSGEAIATWQEFEAGLCQIHAALYKEETWLPQVTVSDLYNSQHPSAGIDEAGNCVIVWNQNNVIRSRSIINGYLSESLPISNPTYVSARPSVAVDAAGNAVAVFERYDQMHKFICGSTLAFNSSRWEEQVDISGPSPASATQAGFPVLALNLLGDGVVVWKELVGENMVIQGAGYSLGTWSFLKTLSNHKGNSGSTNPSYDFGVSFNSTGELITVWPEDPNGKGTQQIKAATGFAVAVSVNESGNILAVWPEADQGVVQIKSTSGVGLAVTAPLPPTPEPTSLQNGIAFGKQVLHRFPAHGDLFNVISWTERSGAAYYNIYRGNLASRIGSSQIPTYEDHQRIPKQTEIYLITTVDGNGQESTPITLVVNPL